MEITLTVSTAINPTEIQISERVYLYIQIYKLLLGSLYNYHFLSAHSPY